MAFVSSIFQESDVLGSYTKSEAVLASASFLCNTALDAIALKYGKPEILAWYVAPEDLVTNTYTCDMWYDYIEATKVEDNAYEREKFAALYCPFTLGFAVVVKFEDNTTVFNDVKQDATVHVDSMILNTDRSLYIYAKLGNGRFYLDLNNVPQFELGDVSLNTEGVRQ